MSDYGDTEKKMAVILVGKKENNNLKKQPEQNKMQQS